MFKHIAAAAGTAMAAAAIGGSALAMASTQHATVTGTEHFQLMTTSATSSKAPFIAYGAFTAGGVDQQGKSTDTVVFANGSFKITHKQTGGTQHLNPSTCLLTINGTATYTLSGGTGAYKGITGSGNAKLSILGVTGRGSTGKCSMKVQPQGFQQLITASGPVSLP